MISNIAKAGFSAIVLVDCFAASAQQATSVSINVKNHRFEPAEIHAPAKVPIELRVKNLDPTPIEFESSSLRAEKVITGHGEAIIRLRPLEPGRYTFFDEFNPKTTGVLVVR